MKIKVVAVVQSRMSSQRLPGKSLVDLEGKPVLERVVERVSRAKLIDTIVVATTTNPADDAVEELCKSKGWNYHRGIEGKVLEQFYDIASMNTLYGVDAVVRITADCAIIDAGLIDEVIDKFLFYYPDIDYGSNVLPRTYPRGLDTEIIKYSTLEREWKGSVDWRVHVTLNLRKNYWKYKTCNVANDKNYSYMRWVIDTAEDLEFIHKIYKHFGDSVFGWEDILKLLEEHKDWVIMDNQEDPK